MYFPFGSAISISISAFPKSADLTRALASFFVPFDQLLLLLELVRELTKSIAYVLSWNAHILKSPEVAKPPGD
jgi:hypothetical protein